MATSNSTNFTMNRDAIIASALRKLRRIDPGLDTPALDITTGTEALNLLIKGMQLDNVFLWLNQEVCLFQQYNTQYYTLRAAGDHCAPLSDSFKTQTSVVSVTDGTTITVDSDDDIEDGDYIGIELNGGTIQWTTVDGAPAANVVTLDDALTDDVAVDNWVFSYTSKISRPLAILEARVRDTDDVDTPLHIITSRTQFFSQTDKASKGRVLDIHYNPGLPDPHLYVWPVCDTGDITDRIIMTIQRVVEDFDASANNFDGPVEALPALIWGLAVDLAPEYGVDITSGKGALIGVMAAKHYESLKRAHRSYEPVYLRP